jgi:hypothetical protein
MSNARSPVLSHFGAAFHGLTSIRAYGVQEEFKKESLRRIDKYSRPGRTFYNLNRYVRSFHNQLCRTELGTRIVGSHS